VVIAVNVAVLVVLLVLLEIGARVFLPRSLEPLFDDPEVFRRSRPFVVAHEERGFALAPGYEYERYRINSAGFRGAELPETIDRERLVMVLGASSTFGWLVREWETFPVYLEDQLAARLPDEPPYLIINAGVPSYSSTQILRYLEELLPRYRPRLVLLNVFWNDLLYSCFTHWMPELLVSQQPAGWRRALLRYSGLFRALTLSDRSTTLRDDVNPQAVDHYRDNLAAMIGLCEQHGASVAIVRPAINLSKVPEDGMRFVADERVTRERLAELAGVFLEEQEQVAATRGVTLIGHRLVGTDEIMLSFDFAHPTPLGQEAIAEDVAEELVGEGLVGGGVSR
jgi:lysophospholipase L1-like esterase